MIKYRHLVLSLFLCICLAGLSRAGDSAAGAEDDWLTGSQLNIFETGMIEAVLPPGLHSVDTYAESGDAYPLDLTITGPDNRPRAFELFWTEKGPTEKVLIDASSLRLVDERRLLWEGSIPDNFNLKGITLGVSDENYLGKVDIQGLAASGWTVLARDIALYTTGSRARTYVDIPDGEYRGLRLYFNGYDREFREIPAFVGEVEIEGETLKTGYAEDTFRPGTEQTYDGDILEIRAALPGSGILIDEVTVTTTSVFQGTWRLGWETITMGEQGFAEIRRGERSLMDNDSTSLVIKLGVQSKGDTLIVRLDSPGYPGEVLDVSIRARLPRMVFFADQTGTYTAQTGTGKRVAIKETTDVRKDIAHQVAEFKEINRNPLWQPYNSARDYMIKGGPFNGDGFTWRSALNIEKPGFYRLVLNDRAGLEDNRQGLRLIKDDTQVPYFFGRKENREINITPAFEYDRAGNRSTMALTLPSTSVHWKEIRLTGEGIFKRRISVETQKPGNMGLQTLVAGEWTSNKKEGSVFSLKISDLPDDLTGMRLVIDHGDNRPVEPKEIKALYQSQDLFFLASEAGEYQVWGGNPKTAPASYDLSIVQKCLLQTRPTEIRMGEIESIKTTGWEKGLVRVFSEQGWGLYGVLGLVTLVLLVIIVRLFPREGGRG